MTMNSPADARDFFSGGPWRVLVLGPHPDDFDAIGVTMRFFARRGDRLEVRVARHGGGVDDDYRPGLTVSGKAALREREQEASARLFGLPAGRLAFLDLETDPGGSYRDSRRNRTLVAALVAALKPDLVCLPHGNDTSRGHRAMYALAATATAGAGGGCRLLLNRDPKTIAMRVDLFMPFGAAEAAWKARLLRCHDSQQQRNQRARGHGFDERVLGLNRKSARELSLPAEYAEVFELESFPAAGRADGGPAR